MSFKSVALVIVNNAILRAEEVSLPFTLISELSSLGFSTDKITILSEDVKIIAYELQTLTKQYDILIILENLKTNVAYKALARTFSEDIACNLRFTSELQQLLEPLEPFDNDDYKLPVASKVLLGGCVFPVVYLQRIFLLKAEHAVDQFRKVLTGHLYNYRTERVISKFIEVNSNGSMPSVEMCSGDVFVEVEKKCSSSVIKLSSVDLNSLNECVGDLKKKYENDIIQMYVPFLHDAMMYDDIHLIEQARKDITKCLDSYGPKNVFIAFNGGKDCTVLLHLLYTVLTLRYPDMHHSIFCLYVQSEQPFPEQDEFLYQCRQYYNLTIKIVKSDIKQALDEILKENPNLKACLMGTRRTDPFSGSLTVFQMSDADWPQVMRVSPLLDWHHSDIWDYLLYYKVFYCKLYDLGYTSLGSVTNTKPNPSLLYYDIFEETEKYLPAYKLLNETKERNGRVL